VTLQGSFGLGGADASNYTLIQPTPRLSADIRPASPRPTELDPKAAAAVTSAQRSWPDVQANVEQGREFGEVVTIRGSGIRLP